MSELFLRQDKLLLTQKFQKNPEEYIGKKAVVKYLMINNEGCVIRNPIVETLADKTNN